MRPPVRPMKRIYSTRGDTESSYEFFHSRGVDLLKLKIRRQLVEISGDRNIKMVWTQALFGEQIILGHHIVLYGLPCDKKFKNPSDMSLAEVNKFLWSWNRGEIGFRRLSGSEMKTVFEDWPEYFEDHRKGRADKGDIRWVNSSPALNHPTIRLKRRFSPRYVDSDSEDEIDEFGPEEVGKDRVPVEPVDEIQPFDDE
ncbi:hypothetical protein C8Q75DRAFT_806149 [Abortiporus biennis]|nr:hypothetical protein C8Q75DRAFT_806149 [Abortiporus biennis]